MSYSQLTVDLDALWQKHTGLPSLLDKDYYFNVIAALDERFGKGSAHMNFVGRLHHHFGVGVVAVNIAIMELKMEDTMLKPGECTQAEIERAQAEKKTNHKGRSVNGFVFSSPGYSPDGYGEYRFFVDGDVLASFCIEHDSVVSNVSFFKDGDLDSVVFSKTVPINPEFNFGYRFGFIDYFNEKDKLLYSVQECILSFIKENQVFVSDVDFSDFIYKASHTFFKKPELSPIVVRQEYGLT